MTRKLLGISVLFSFLALTLVSPASAQSPQGMEKKTKLPKHIDLVCMQNAIEVRETGMFSAFGDHMSNLKASLENRHSDLIAAWKIENNTERKTALKNIFETFKAERKEERDAYHAKKQDISTTFQAERKACGSNVQNENGSVNE